MIFEIIPMFINFFFHLNYQSNRHTHLDQCGNGWLAWDNSCYKHGDSPTSISTFSAGIDYCATKYDAEVFVPNSIDEAKFIGKYLSGTKVKPNLLMIKFPIAVI